MNNLSIPAMECHLAKERNDLPRHGDTGMNLQFILPSERALSEGYVYYRIQLQEIVSKAKMERLNN